jgi:formylglycine-generating enzyme required for sulfatase activity
MFLRIFVLLLVAANVFAQIGTLKIVSNASGTIKIDGEDKGSIDANAVKKFDLKADEYIVQFYPPTSNNPITKEVTIQIGKSETINFEVTGISQNKINPENNSNTFIIEVVYVPGGSFTMGCTSEQGSACDGDEKPSHTVNLSSFYIGKYEITQAQWRAVMGTNPSYNSGCDNCPVEQVSWNDVLQFIQKLNQQTGKRYRPPTEAEWEYAARGGNKSRGYKYSGSNDIGAVAWYDGNSGNKTHPVGQKSPNELGIYDMSGNVWEWCSDWYADDYYSSSPSSNPQGPSTGSHRVLRGGGWFSAAASCQVANRNGSSPGYRNNYYGFRVLLSQ